MDKEILLYVLVYIYAYIYIIDLEGIILSEISHTKKDKYCMISFFMESFKQTNEAVTKPKLTETKNRLVIIRGKVTWIWKRCVGCECVCVCVCVCVCMLSCIQLFVTPCPLACQAPLCMEFSGQEYWRGLSFPTPWMGKRGQNKK